MARILIVDDEPDTLNITSKLCRDFGHRPLAFASLETALKELPHSAPDLAILGANGENNSGLAILRECRTNFPHTDVLILATDKSIRSAVEAMRLGASDYVAKPLNADGLRVSLQRALETLASYDENDPFAHDFADEYKYESILGSSPKMRAVYRLIAKVADTESTILIQGEKGTGKELVARALHYNSSRRHHPFLVINCSALSENDLESELFGHRQGVLSGAAGDKTGLFEMANGGTLFLDEVDSMPQPLQTKLLRVLQDRQIRRAGDSRGIPVSVRTIAASSEDLLSKSRSGEFREDLYYRLSVIEIQIPPLRERLEDVPVLVDYFLQRYGSRAGSDRMKIEPAAMDRLASYDWPGDVQELENAVERACTLSEGGVIAANHLPQPLLRESESSLPAPEGEWHVGQHLEDFVRTQERKYIEMTLQFNRGSREKTATMLGISIATLYRKLDLKHQRGRQA